MKEGPDCNIQCSHICLVHCERGLFRPMASLQLSRTPLLHTICVLGCSAGTPLELHCWRAALPGNCTISSPTTPSWGQAIGLVMDTHRFHSAASRACVASYAARSSNVPTCSWLDTSRQLDSAAGSRPSSSSIARSTCCVAGGLLLNSFKAWIAAPRTLVIVCEQKM
jgi:hypothetical protein